MFSKGFSVGGCYKSGLCCRELSEKRKHILQCNLIPVFCLFFLQMIIYFVTVFSIHLMKNTLLNPFPNKPWLHVCCTSCLKTLWEKKKLLITSNFSFSLQCFLPLMRTKHHFPQIKNCRLQSLLVWRSLKFVV